METVLPQEPQPLLRRHVRLVLLALLSLVWQPAFSACPGCCSSHGGIGSFCASNGRIYCRDGTVSPSCLCSTCGVSSGGGLPLTCTGGQVPSGGSCVCPLNQVLVSGSCQAVSKPQTGWWWNPGESGRGYFIEQRGNSIFMAGFLYDNNGNPDWFVANAPVSATNSFDAPMLRFANGQTLTSGYRAPTPATSLGTVHLTFSSPTQALMTWPGGQLPLIRFAFGGSGTGTPQNGWWWNPAEGGRGFSIEIQGGTVFAAGYLYNEQGAPIWYTTAGRLATTTRYFGVWQSFRDGQLIGQAYRQPVLLNANAGLVAFDFLTPTTAQMTLPDGRQIPIKRFEF